jgi:DNA-binding MarR family transcriptional regulator
MTMNRLYHVTLTDEERATLVAFLKKGAAKGRKYTRAHILLLADETDASDAEIAALLHTSPDTVQRTRKKFVEGNLEGALNEKRRPGARVKLTPAQERQVTLLACSDAPEGRTTWTMQLLADRLVTLEIVDALSDETVRRTLKKMNSSPGKRATGASRR